MSFGEFQRGERVGGLSGLRYKQRSPDCRNRAARYGSEIRTRYRFPPGALRNVRTSTWQSARRKRRCHGNVGARHRKRDGYFGRVFTDIPQREAQNRRGDARLRLKTTNHQLMNVHASQLIPAQRDQERPVIMSWHCPVDRRRIQSFASIPTAEEARRDMVSLMDLMRTLTRGVISQHVQSGSKATTSISTFSPI